MTTVVDAVYEQGWLKPLTPLVLPEHARVQVPVTSEISDDLGRQEWLAQSERTLLKIWDNSADDIYNELLKG